jgi:dienelactone hydrolase
MLMAICLNGTGTAEEGRIGTPHKIEVIETNDSRMPIVALQLPLVRDVAPLPTVILVADTLGPDGRGDGYADALLRAGFIVVEVDVFIVLDGDPFGIELNAPLHDRRPLAAPLIAQVADAIGRHPLVDRARVAALGFGAGGRAVLTAPEGGNGSVNLAARIALYPGCGPITLPAGERDGRAAARRAPALIVHGTLDSANEPTACIAMVERLSPAFVVDRLELPEAGYGWDRPLFPGDGRMMMANPGTGERVVIASWPYMARCSEEAVTEWLSTSLDAPATNARNADDHPAVQRSAKPGRCGLRWSRRAIPSGLRDD